jgi:hypothetical protein
MQVIVVHQQKDYICRAAADLHLWQFRVNEFFNWRGLYAVKFKRGIAE